jgi:hypothetical protein
MTQIDANQEAVARIQMAVDQHNAIAHCMAEDTEANGLKDEQPTSDTGTISNQHWSLGDAEKHISASELEHKHRGNPWYCRFCTNLISFFNWEVPSNISHTASSDIKVSICVHLSVYSQLMNTDTC